MPKHDKIQAFIQHGTELLQKRAEPAKKLLQDIALVESNVQELQKQKAALIERKIYFQKIMKPFPGIYDELMQLVVSMPEKDKIPLQSILASLPLIQSTPLQSLLASCMPLPQTVIPAHWQSLGLNSQGFWHYLDKKTQVVLIHIPAGRFWLGASPEDAAADSDEKPSQEVFLDEYFIAQTPLTCGQYKIFWEETKEKGRQKELFSHVYEILGADEWLEYSKKLDFAGKKGWNFFYCSKENQDYAQASFQNREQMISLLCNGPQWWTNPQKAPLAWKEYDDSHPAIGVSWLEAYSYCLWAGYRLPSEAQWEKAGKGGLYLDGEEIAKVPNDKPKRVYPWGDVWNNNKCNNSEIGLDKTTSVNDSRFDSGVSPYGCRDMAGNVWEWCLDLYDKNFYDILKKEQEKGTEIRNPVRLKTEGFRVCRGGSWCNVPVDARVSRRGWRHPAYRLDFVGFRVGAGVFLDSVL